MSAAGSLSFVHHQDLLGVKSVLLKRKGTVHCPSVQHFSITRGCKALVKCEAEKVKWYFPAQFVPHSNERNYFPF